MNLRPRHREDPGDQLDLDDRRAAGAVDLLHGLDHVQSGGTGEGATAAGERRSRAARPHEPLVITVTAEGAYRVNERTLINSSPDTLRAALLKEAGTDRGPITIRADARTTHQAVVTAMDVAGSWDLRNSTSPPSMRTRRLERSGRRGCESGWRFLVDLSAAAQIRQALLGVFLIGVLGAIMFAAANAALAYWCRNFLHGAFIVRKIPTCCGRCPLGVVVLFTVRGIGDYVAELLSELGRAAGHQGLAARCVCALPAIADGVSRSPAVRAPALQADQQRRIGRRGRDQRRDLNRDRQLEHRIPAGIAVLL